MIRFGVEKDKEELLELCVHSQPIKEKAFLEYYFQNQYEDSKVLLCELDNKLISQLHCREHVVHWQGKKLMCSYLFGVATHYDYRKRGIMNDLMEMTLEDCGNNYLLTFIEALNPHLFEKYGFEVLSWRKRYVIYAKELLKYSTTGVEQVSDAKRMAEVYKKFSQMFDCYYERDEEYYTHYIARVKKEGMEICMHFDKEGKADGYALYRELDEGIEIKEIMYLHANVLLKLLKFAIGYNPFISVEVSHSERLEKLFKLSIPRTFPAVMVRVNHFKLYNKLYNSNIKNTKELVAHMQKQKPVLLHEKY